MQNRLFANIGLSILLYGMVFPRAGAQQSVSMVAEPQKSTALSRTQLSIRENASQFRLFHKAGPVSLLVEAPSVGASVGYRKALGVNQNYWAGVYGYLPWQVLGLFSDRFELFDLIYLPFFSVVGVEGGMQALQGSINVFACPRLSINCQLSLYCGEVKLFGLSVLPHIGGECAFDKFNKSVETTPFGKLTITLPKLFHWCAVEVKNGYSFQQNGLTGLKVSINFGQSSQSKHNWLNRQLNTMPYLGINNLEINNFFKAFEED